MAIINQLAHACVAAESLSEAEKFFSGLLGMQIQFRFMKGEKVIGYYFNAGNGTYIEVFEGASLPNDKPVLRHLCLETDSIDDIISKFKAGGTYIGEKKKGADQSYQVWTKGPNGLDIEFHQYTPESCQKTRKDCFVNW
ncbi:MAG: VOC family protein [Fibrobacteres bacterium]|nr:VOC family protein [Fibrobacterota bacterium]